MHKKPNWFKNCLKKINKIPKLWMSLFFMLIFTSLINPRFLSINNLLNLSKQISVQGILSLGMLLVILSGEIDLSIGSTLCITSIFAAAAQNAGLPLYSAILISLGAGALIGLFIGILVVKRNIPSLVVTLALMYILRGGAIIISRGKPAIAGLYSSFIVVGQGSILGIPNLIFIFIIVSLLFHFLLSSTIFGSRIYAIGSNREAAIFSGIKVDNLKIWVFIIMGITSALAGLLLTARLGAANSEMGNLYELNAIAVVIVGGTLFSGGEGSVSRMFPAILILGILPNILNFFDVSPFLKYQITGLIIISAYFLTNKRIWKKAKTGNHD